MARKKETYNYSISQEVSVICFAAGKEKQSPFFFSLIFQNNIGYWCFPLSENVWARLAEFALQIPIGITLNV